MYHALELAKYIINQSIKNHSPLTNLQVQNILYAVQKDCLKHGDKAFPDLFEAWYSGPVIPNVYYSLGIYGGAPILWEQETEKNRSCHQGTDPESDFGKFGDTILSPGFRSISKEQCLGQGLD